MASLLHPRYRLQFNTVNLYTSRMLGLTTTQRKQKRIILRQVYVMLSSSYTLNFYGATGKIFEGICRVKTLVLLGRELINDSGTYYILGRKPFCIQGVCLKHLWARIVM